MMEVIEIKKGGSFEVGRQMLLQRQRDSKSNTDKNVEAMHNVVGLKGLDQQTSAALNRNTVLRLVRRYGPISRAQLWKQSRLGHSTIAKIIRDLQKANLLIEAGQAESSGGKRAELLALNSCAKCTIVVIWDTRTIALVNLLSQVRIRRTISASVNEKVSAEVVKAIAGAVEDLLAECNIAKSDVLGLGLLLAGDIDQTTGTVVVSGPLCWADVPIKSMLEESVQLRVYPERALHAIAMGEYLYGAGQRGGNIAAVAVGPGAIGASLIVDGKILRGKHNCSGEIGHIPVMENGPTCRCGNQGCLEAVLAELLKDGLNEGILERLAYYISLGVAFVVNTIDPETVILCGSIIEDGGDKLMKLVLGFTKRMFFGCSPRQVLITKGELGQMAAIKGICGFINEKVFHSEAPC